MADEFMTLERYTREILRPQCDQQATATVELLLTNMNFEATAPLTWAERMSRRFDRLRDAWAVLRGRARIEQDEW